MLSSILSFTPDQAETVSEYCENHSDGTKHHLFPRYKTFANVFSL